MAADGGHSVEATLPFRALRRPALLAALAGLAACGGGPHLTAPTTRPGTTTVLAPTTSAAATTDAPASTRAPARSAPAGTSTTGSPAPTTAAAPAGGLRGATIALDPGHNGENFSHPSIINAPVFVGNGSKACDTTGTVTADGYTEAAYNFDVATRLAALLRAAGATVVLTRPDNNGVGPCVTQRAAIGNQAHADAAISIHADGGPPGGRGFHVIQPAPIAGYNTAIVAPSDRLALDVRRDYQAATGMPFSTYTGSSGLETRSDLGGLNLSTVPKVFIETGNMQNPTDVALLESPDYRQKVATGLFNAFADFLAGR